MADKKDIEKKPNAIRRWYRETTGELHKVSWPTRAEAFRMTQLVLLVMILMGAMLGIVDFMFSRLVAILVS